MSDKTKKEQQAPVRLPGCKAYGAKDKCPIEWCRAARGDWCKNSKGEMCQWRNI